MGPRRRGALLRVAWMALVLGAGAGLLAMALLGRLSAPWGEVRGRVAEPCRLQQGACTAVFEAGRLTVQVDGLVPGPTSTLRLRVVPQGIEPRSVAVDLNGATMNMGPNHTVLTRQGDGSWLGETSLTACVSGPMVWAVEVRADAGAGAWLARFLFDSGA